MKFSEGEQVLAKYPNTSEYYKGRIINVRGDRYKIQFETGAAYTVSQNDIKYERQARARGRKSPSRQSPSRKSPSRRSPARSPNMAKKLPIRSSRTAKISLSRINIESDKLGNHKEEIETRAVQESPFEVIPLQQRLKEITTPTRRSARLSSLKTDEHKLITLTRSIDRAVSLPVDKKGYLRSYSPGEKDKDLEGIEKLDAPTSREKEIHRVDNPQEWGGWIGTFFLIFILPLSIILPQFLCTKEQCKSRYLQFPTGLESYINPYGFLSYVVFLILLSCISIIPIGKSIDGQQSKIGILQYRLNGYFGAILSIATLGLCIHKNIPVSDYILNNLVQLAISGWLIGTILALGLYFKAGRISVAKLNMYASTNSKIYNFWQGKELNPRIGSLDIKLILMRASLIGTFIINVAIAIKAVGDAKSVSIEQLNIAALLAVFLQLFYITDGLIYEGNIFTSFAIMYEGTGYMTCVSHLLYPFLPTLLTRFLLYQKIKLNYFAGIFVLSFIIGYALYRASNSRKNEFRKNPVSPAVPYLETIPTSRGKKLMLSGLWGYVRHPNYLGDIIMQWSLACIGLATDILPYYAAICCTFTLAYRAIRDNRRCHTRYGYAWEQYCTRVKYMILKRIF